MPKNKVTAKLTHGTRDRSIYELIKANLNGLISEEIVDLSGYAINQVSSAVSNLLDAGHIKPDGERVNYKTGFKVMVLKHNPSHMPDPNRISRRGELARLRKQVVELSQTITELKGKYDFAMKAFKQYVAKVTKV